MEEETVGVEMDEEMDMEEPDGDGSDVEEEEEDMVEDLGSSPLQQPSSGPGSTPTSNASSPPVNDDLLPSYPFTGKPLSIRRGPGRPRKEGKPLSRTNKSPVGLKFKKLKTSGYGRGMPKRVRSMDRADSDAHSVPPSPSEESGTLLDPETGALILASDKSVSISEEPPYFIEQWPGKVCALCNLGERTQLGQGELMKLSCPEGFQPTRKQPSDTLDHLTSPAHDTCTEPERENGDKSPRGGPVAVTCRRQKSFNKCRNPSMNSEYVDELTIIGHAEEPDSSNVFESDGSFFVHQSCAIWSSGVVKTDSGEMDNVASVVSHSLSRKCSSCGHFGASLICRVASCPRLYHFPCATAAGAFQDAKTTSMFCSQHLGQVPLLRDSSNEVTCMTCYALGDVSNLMFCSTCGQLHHGTCVGLAQLPGVRAGWQCKDCKLCQICRTPGEDTKLMSCEQCDKAYHAHCLRPIVTSIPKYGWKCKCCRICGDCGSRTPGAGQSSRWHAHYTVCDSCYQQRNKGFSCPLCHRAYRAHAYREMVQCSFCRRFVHGTCDPEADLTAYQHRKETNPEYDYVCPACKSISMANRQSISKRKDSIDDADSNYSGSQDALYMQDDPYMLDIDTMSDKGPDDAFRAIGLGKGKPYCASKIAKKRLGLGVGMPGRPKGVGKAIPGKFGQQKRQRFGDFGRKRGPKSKMRGIFGVPGVGLQRPVGDANSKSEDEPGTENRLVLCSAKDKFVLTQDICVMCGALGTDQEGCLIACAQCGQCYHPYCVNINRVTKVILEKGWRCLDCTICEGCGQKNDEARLILCDECDISYHIYCMDPPLEYVPSGCWKCKWCAMCQTCGSHDPGLGSAWMNSYSECGPCASQNTCPCCSESYSEGELVINCARCDRWLHATCDSIKTEADAERCSEEGYNCILCRPKDVPPPHLVPNNNSPPKPPTPTKSPEIKINSAAQYLVDGVYLSEIGLTQIKALSMEQQQQQASRKKRKKLSAVVDKEAGIMATIESVVAGGSIENSLEETTTAKLELVDVKEEPQEVYKEGMIWTPKTDGAPPEGFTIYTTDSGVTLLRRKRQRNLQKLGIGGFLVRMRGTRGGQDNDDVDMLPGQSGSALPDIPVVTPLVPAADADKPRRKPARRKPKGKLAESYPVYLQEAFFGRDLLDTVKDKEPDSGSGSDEEGGAKSVTEDKIVHLSQDELKAIEAVKAKQEMDEQLVTSSGDTKTNNNEMVVSSTTSSNIVPKEEDDCSDSEALKDVLTLPGDLIDNDLVNTIMNEDNEEMAAKNADTLESLADSNLGDDGDLTNSLPNTDGPSNGKDELSDILGSHFNLEAIPNMNSKDVEEIFKGVLTDESQESQESMFPLSSPNVFTANNTQQATNVSSHHMTGVGRSQTVLPAVGQANLNSPMSFPSQSPYNSEYSNYSSPQFSPAFSEPPSPWISAADNSADPESSLPSVAATSYNQRSSEKMKVDEALGSGATISAVLYANMNHPEWKTEYPNWNERCKQILKKWRALSSEKKAPYLQQARDNRSALRMKKAQQMNKDTPSPTGNARPLSTSGGAVSTTLASPSSIVQQQQQHQQQQQATAVGTVAGAVIVNSNNGNNVASNIMNTIKPPVTSTVTTSSSSGQIEVCTVQQSKLPAQRLTIATATTDLVTTTVTALLSSSTIVTSTPPAVLTPSSSSTSSTSSSQPSPSPSPTLIAARTPTPIPTLLAGAASSSSSIHRSSTSTVSRPPPSISILPVQIPVQIPLPSIPSPPTQQQFTVHGQFIGLHNHTGPAPNVTVNPHYQQHPPERPVTSPPPPPPPPSMSRAHIAPPVPPPPAADQQIRVLTPSEIMRTLPSLCQDTYDIPPVSQPPPPQPPPPSPLAPPSSTDQDKITQQQKTVREAEQERQWKQLQALRQQQAQQQQQVIHDQRVQAIARVHRQISESGQQFNQPDSTGLTNQLQVSTTQDLSPVASPSPRQFVTPAVKGARPMPNQSPTFQHPNMPAPRTENVPVRPASLPLQRPAIRTPGQPQSPFSPQPVQSPHEFPPNMSPSAQSESFQRPPPSESGSDPYLQSPQTPRPQFASGGQQSPSPQRTPTYTPRLPADPYAQQPSTPRPQFAAPRPAQAGFPQGLRQQGALENPEINRHLRELLQRQQFKKLDDQLLPGKQRVWPPTDGNQSDANQQFETPTSGSLPGVGDVTFRHPLPPGIVRPRIPLSQNGALLVRQQGTVGLRLPNQADPRMMGLDPRMRLILQQRTVGGNNITQQFPTAHILNRPPASPRPVLDPYDPLAQRQQINFQNKQSEQQHPNMGPSINVNQNIEHQRLTGTNQQVPLATAVSSNSTTTSGAIASTTSETQEIPDNVTAELEKLEQENGGMAEVEGVGDILGGLADDDDELLAEMGADFNILEYADPELDALTGGEKTNILDSLDLEESEPDKDEKKDIKQIVPPKANTGQIAQPLNNIANVPVSVAHAAVLSRAPQSNNPAVSLPSDTGPMGSVQPPPLVVSEAQSTIQQTTQQSNLQISTHHHQQQIQQHMQQQVQQAAALGRPMAPGTRLVSQDGAVGIVTNNNGVTVTYPPNYPQRVAQTQLQLQSQRIQMRMGPGGFTRMMSVGPNGPVLHAGAIGLGPQARMGLPPPPPPPYPGPPPPYPGPAAQMGLRGIGAVHHLGPPRLPLGLMHHLGPPQGMPIPSHIQRRPLLLQEQPLLLEDLLEQEKREQEKQMQNQLPQSAVQDQAHAASNNALLTDQDYEKLHVDVLRSVSSPPQGLPAQGLLPVSSVSSGAPVRLPFINRTAVQTQNPQWQQAPARPAPALTPQTVVAHVETAANRVPSFNASLLPAPPLPPEHIVTEQDRQIQLHYEQWLNHQNAVLTQQLKYYETEVQKLRKIRKSLNSKQRQLKKSGNQLAEPDALELKRISSEQSILQKQLEASRKQSRQHGMLVQEYRNKQQAKQQQRQQAGHSPLMMSQQSQSPLGPPASSPIHSSATPQSPMMSPTASSPMTAQHNSPLHSPAALVSPSPGPASVATVLPSPGNQPTNSMSPLGMQPSPRIGTPHSQGEANSPGPVQSPSQVCLPPPTPRMTSPQHRRLVTSPVGYTTDLRATQQNRFIRPPGAVVAGGDVSVMQGQRPRLTLQTVGFQQGMRSGGPSPLGSPQPGQQPMTLTSQQHQQLLQRQQQLQQQQQQLQQQALHQQQQQDGNLQNDGGNILQSQRALQMIQQRQLILQQQQQQHQQQQQQQQQMAQQRQQQLHHQQMLQQQQQLAKQQQQQLAAQMQQSQQGGRSPMQQPPSSPMPRSPMVQNQQIMSPHHSMQQPQSPMPPKSPLVQLGYSNQPPSSPMPRSPMLHQPPSSPMLQQQMNQHHGNMQQTSTSPHPRSPMLSQMPSPMGGMRRPPSTSNSPAIPDRPQSVENPGTPRTPYNEHDSGGGNPHNPTNPIPMCPNVGRFGYVKLGLRGGSPMWSFGRGPKRPPTLPQNMDVEKAGPSDTVTTKVKKESHLSKVSILKKKTPVKMPITQPMPAKVASLVCADYNEFDDSSSTPPVTPPPSSSNIVQITADKKLIIQKANEKKLLEEREQMEAEEVMIIDSSPDEKQDEMHCDAIVDYDYDNDKTLVATEVSLSSVAQQVDADDITVIQTFTQDLDVISSPLATDVTEEYVLFQSDMVVDISVDSNDSMKNLEEQYHDKDGDDDDDYGDDLINIDGKNVEIVAIQSPTSSDEELIMRGKLVQGLPGEGHQEIQVITDTPESPDQEEMNVDPSPEPFVTNSDDFITNLDDSEIVIIDPTMKSPEEHIATKEDFEELIDGEKREEKLHIPDSLFTQQFAQMHQYANMYTFPPKTSPPSYQQAVSSPLYSQSSSSTSDTNSNCGLIVRESNSTITVVTTPVLSPVLSVSQSSKANTELLITRQKNISSNAKTITLTVAAPQEIDTITVKTETTNNTVIPVTSSSSSVMESVTKAIIRKEPTVNEVTFTKKLEPSSSLTLNTHVASLPRKIFEDECTSPDESICQDDLYSPIRKTFTADLIKPVETESSNTDTEKEEPIKDQEEEEEVEQKVEDKKDDDEVVPDKPELEPEVKKEDEETAVSSEKSEPETVNEVCVPESSKSPVDEKAKETEVQFSTSVNILAKEIVFKNMTAKSQEKCSIGNICVAQRDGQIETIPASFITHTDLDDNNTDLTSKSVVISIPSPTPSQEQMLDNIAMQELVETRRRDGKGFTSEFESIEDVLNMIENITGEQPTVLDDKDETEKKLEDKCNSPVTMPPLMDTQTETVTKPKETITAAAATPTSTAVKEPEKVEQPEKEKEIIPKPVTPPVTKSLVEAQQPITVNTTSSKSTVMSQLSPLSQPAELTSNMANVSQQLRTLLSSLHTNTITTTSNVETIAQSVKENDKISAQVTAPSTTSSVMTSKISQQTTDRSSPVVTCTGIVTLTNAKQKTVASTIAVTTSAKSSPKRIQSPVILQSQLVTTSPLTVVSSATVTTSVLIPTSVTAFNATAKPSASGIQLMPDHPKLPLITTVAATPTTTTILLSNTTASSFVPVSSTPLTTSTSVSTVCNTPSTNANTNAMPVRKTSTPSLNAMLQSHPAATVPQSTPGTITTASLLGISRSAFISTSQSPLTVSSGQNMKISITPSSLSFSTATPSSSSNSLTFTSLKPIVSTTNLLHTQLTKAPLKRSKSIDDPSSTAHPHFIKKEDLPVRSESLDDSSQVSSTGINVKQEIVVGGCKYSNLLTSARTEDSQNVLLKQLLQNTGCASTQAQSTSVTHTAPNLPLVPSLEAQLARPVPPTPTSLLPPLLHNDTQTNQPPKTTTRHTQKMSRETSFVSRPPQKSPTTTTTVPVTSQPLQIVVKKCLPPSRTPSRDELLSPPTPRSSGCGSQESSLQTPPLVIKKEATTTVPYPSPVEQLSAQEVKKELLDESSQHSEVSDLGRPDIQTKEESSDALDISGDKSIQDQAALELKKLKRRQYQQKRRQNQILSKDAAGQPKKRARKSSKVEEDYDTFIDNLMIQLRQLPPMVVTEPVLGRNFAVCPLYGSGDLPKIGTKDYDTRYGDLTGTYGYAIIPDTSDFYSTKPYGDNDPLPEKPPPSTQRLFYDQEFPPVRFETDDDRRLELFCRDNETPDSIVSSSSPECPLLESPIQFAGLRLIQEDNDSDDEVCNMRMSPVIPIIAPIPIRLKPNGPYLKDYAEVDKENAGLRDPFSFKSRFANTPVTPLKDSGNVTVTLTLTSSAAEDIMGVLRDLANILHIPAPTGYQIIERTNTPPSHKLGLYRTKGKDGKEGAPIDIQSILNGAAKFCRHCDVVILNNLIRKRVSDLPFLYKEPDLLCDGDELYFCSSACYMQFALMHRTPSMTQDKAAAIVDHLCQDKDATKKKSPVDPNNDAPLEKSDTKDEIEKMDVDEIVSSIKQEYKDDFPCDEAVKETSICEANVKSELSDITTTTASPQKSRKHPADEVASSQPPVKVWKGSKYKQWNQGALLPKAKYKRPTDKEIMEMMFRLGVTVTPSKIPDDTRKCMFCHMIGDAVADGPARLLNFDVDKWVHLNCALWSEGVYETVNGALMNLENALQQSFVSTCIHCQQTGATIHCFKVRCSNVYHLGCAVKDGCMFYKDKTTYCMAHIPKAEKDNELTTLSVSRRVYVQRDENRQVAAVMHQSDHNHLLRVGSLIFLNVGQLLPHQLQNFHTANYIYPVGYKIIRFYWSMRRISKRCRYVCSIHDVSGRPEFRVLVQEPSQDDVELRDNSPRAVWNRILEPLAALRKEHHCVQLYPQYVTGEDLFGLTEPAVVRVLESLPGIETLSDYRFKYGRNPLLELPLAINPSGAARAEPRLRNQLPWKRPHTQRTGSSARPVFVPTAGGAGEAACPYSKQFVHSKSSQYKKMKQEWRNNVFLARSKIQGLGLYAARDLEKHTMVIEYIGEIIRTELAETREKQYEAKNRGIYMFRLDEERVVDATLSGGLARYINHSCNPNCVAEIVEVDRDLRIIIFAKRRIARGEELAYDYKFDIEDDQHKISCMCGAPNCRKWMN